MVRLFLPLLALLILAELAPAFGDSPPIRKVTVIGEAVIEVSPDEMDWTAQVSINDTTPAKAKARHDASLTASLNYLKGLGNSLANIQTSGIKFDKAGYIPDDSDLKKNPYSCSTQITFKLLDFQKYGAICDALVKLDGVQVQSIDYTSSKDAPTRREALKQALLNAHDKASDLAVTAGCYIDKPLDIHEGTIDTGSDQRVIEDQGMAPAQGTPNAVVDKIKISATVTVTYDLFYK